MSGGPARRAYLCVSHSPMMTLPGLGEYGPHYRAAVDHARELVRAFAPDLVVAFCPDHMNMHRTIRPQYTIVLTGEQLAEFGLPPIRLAVDTDVAARISTRLAGDVDIAVAEGVEIDHGLGLTLGQIFERPADVPLVPVVVNAIGFPLAPVRRASAVGAAVGAALDDHPGKVLFVGSGGLSHHPPFPWPAPGARRLTDDERAAALDEAAGYIDDAWDRRILDAFARGVGPIVDGLEQPDIDRRGGGANEVRVWAAAWAACGHGPASYTAYEPVPEWITGMGVAYGTRQ